MQTFLPYESFAASARVLDSVRLNAQIKECTQILRAALGLQRGYAQHPCVIQWQPNLALLLKYQSAMHHEWRQRFNHPAEVFHKSYVAAREIARDTGNNGWSSNGDLPFLGQPAFHRSHREMLLAKNFQYYQPHFEYPTPPVDPYYIWWSPTLGFYRIERDYYQQLTLG